MAEHGSTRAAQGPQGGRPARRALSSRSAGGPAGAAVDAAMPRAAGGNLAVGQALGAGAPLDESTRAVMQARYGADFSQVRVHQGLAAASSADALHANAYAVGHDIVFGPGRYAPHTREGRRLLAHELAHVVQQSRGGPRPALDPSAPHEQAADRAADAVVGGSGTVAVEGATGVGVAADVKGWLSEKYQSASELVDEAKALVPDEVKEVASDAVDLAVEYGPYAAGPLVGTIADFQRAAITDIKEHVTGVDDPEAKGLRETAAHKVDLAVGVSKGAVSQVSDLADTVIWAGSEVRDAKDAMVEKTAEVAGIDPETAKTISKVGGVLLAPLMPAAAAADLLGEANDALVEADWVDESGKPGLTAKVQEGYDLLGDAAIEALGVEKETDEGLFTTREKGELVGAIGIQVAGAFIGATEVKVGLAAVGALGGIRAIVETMRAHPNDFYAQPSFWSGLLGTAMSIVGLKGGGVRKKIIDIALKSGTLLQVVPHLWQLYNDYNDPELQKDEKKYNETLERDINAVVRAVVDVVVMIARNGASGRKTPAYEGGAPKGGPATEPGANAAPKSPAAASAEGGNVTPAPSTEGQTGAVKPPSAAKLKKADLRAQGAKQKAAKADTGAKKAEDAAAAREAAAQKSKARADAERAKAEKNAQTLKDKQAKADEKAQAAIEAKQKAEANGGEAKAKAKLDKQAAAAEKAAANAKTQAANAQKRADAARARADTAGTKSAAAEKKAQEAKAKANEARAKAKKAESKAQEAKQKAEDLRGPVDPRESFADLNEPSDALPSSGKPFKPNAEPNVWVRTGKGKIRWSYVPEGDKRFGKGEGVTMPKSQADDMNFAPAGEKPKVVPITPRVGANGKPVESAGAGGRRGSKFASASAKEASAVKETSIRPDINENQAYRHHLDNGEYGILRPQGSNAPGVDSITARIEFDAAGKPVRAKIFLNDVTTPTAAKGAKPTHANWQQELAAALDPKAPPGQRLDFGDPAIDAVIRKAAADGNVHVRVVRTTPTASGHQSVTIDPAETIRVGPIGVRLPNVAEVREDEKGEED